MDDQDDLKTQPTATAIMERLQSMEAHLLGEISTLATRKEMLSQKEELTTQFTQQILSLRAELTTQFTTQFTLLSRKIQVLNDDILTVRAGQLDILKLLNDSEEKIRAS